VQRTFEIDDLELVGQISIGRERASRSAPGIDRRGGERALDLAYRRIDPGGEIADWTWR
jgi:hypothetical protein